MVNEHNFKFKKLGLKGFVLFNVRSGWNLRLRGGWPYYSWWIYSRGWNGWSSNI